ncbi:MAG: hypothetical protein GXY51_02610 [Bacteroidetes bacterium]|nr:hypothetical protein [Bacteroidota bacterium]
MTNKEWLENIKRVDDKRKPSDLIPIYEFRKAKALEIIAEELIKLNSTYTDAKKMNHLEDLVRELDIRVCTLISKVRGDND